MTPHTGSCTLATSSPRKRAVPTRWTSRPGLPDTNSRDSVSSDMRRSVPSWCRAPSRETRCAMSVLVTTTDGYHIFTSSGKQLRSLEGHRVDSFTPGPDGTFLAVIDRHEVWSHGSDGEWTPLAKSELTLTAVVAAGDAVFAGTDDARVLRLGSSGALAACAGFDTV